jgi:hypothetical protein
MLSGARMRLSSQALHRNGVSPKSIRRQRCWWRWWRGGEKVGIGVGGGSRRSGEEEAGGIGRRQNHTRQHHTLVAARLVTGGVCVCVVYWS